ncbi:hypothetical protein A4A49_30025 [Nicotiana attenuata]|uniref:Carboxypeptidase A inhibitor-like domain-containing protein n=1 Tax=Nicotiana attenuata TaxID=49451 RepID=A0A1J6KUD7_NICAT|nr:hypothetical protein A4A49_30025 [Nicotiana attenuata]
MALLKFGFVFTILLVATTINTPWFSKMQVMAARDDSQDLSRLERRLLPQRNDILTCARDCKYNSECKADCWICCICFLGTCNVDV